MSLFLQTAASGLTVGAIYALIALGFALVLGTLKVVDFTYGMYVLLSAYVTFWCSTRLLTGAGLIDAVLCILIGVGAAALAGALVWGLALRRLLERSHLAQLVGTMGIVAVIGGILLSGFGTDVVLAKFTPTSATLQWGPVYLNSGRIAGGLIGLGALVVFAFLLKTRLGLMIQAIAMDPKGAALIGIEVFRLRIITVAMGAALGGLAGGLLVTFLPVNPGDGNKFLLIAFFTVAIGGLGSLRGALAGAFLIAMIEALSQNYLPNLIKNAVPYLMVGLFIALLPQGLGNIRIALARKP